MIKKTLITAFGILVIIGLLAGVKALQIKTLIDTKKTMVMPAESVTTAVAELQSWRPAYEAVGNVVAVQGVTVTTEAPGKIVALSIESGAFVQEGDILVELDASLEKAQLVSAEAAAQLARINLQRAVELRQNQTIAQSDLDTVEAQAKQAEAQIDHARAAIDKKTIRAPFSGRLGLRMVNLGQFVASGQAIVSLQSIDPIYVDFSLPQQRLLDMKEGLAVEVTTDATEKRIFNGSISAISANVDSDSRNVKIRATLPNADGVLRPGMFVSSRVLQSASRDVVVIPATSVVYAPYGDSVFLVVKSESGEGNIAVQKFVRLGETRGDFVEVKEGVAAGQSVVSNGAFKLRNGVSVTIHNDRAPETSLAPTPSDT